MSQSVSQSVSHPVPAPVTAASAPGQQPDLAALGRRLACLHLPGTPGYAEHTTPWNVAVAVQPLAVVAARSADDVVTAVSWAHRHRVPVTVQATGHGATASLSGVLLVSTRALTTLEVDPVGRTARVGAGVQWTALLEAAAPHGLAGLAGSAPHVGVVGYVTGGGVGPVARTHGLASDRVRAVEVVTGDGVLRRATPTEHADLFWALRGGKGLLGIVTAVEIDLVAQAELYAGALYFDGGDAAEVLHRWARWSAELPPQATTSVALLRLPDLPDVPPPLAGQLSVSVRFAWTGDAADGERALAPLREAATALIDTVATIPYAALGAIHADPVAPMPTHEEHALLGELGAEAVEALLAAAGPASSCGQVVVELRQLGGAIGRRVRRSSAFDHRDAGWSLLTIGVAAPPVLDQVAADGRAVVAAVAPWTVPGGLPNFAPRAGSAWLRRTYTDSTLRRLSRISHSYDPHATIHGVAWLRAAAPRGLDRLPLQVMR